MTDLAALSAANLNRWRGMKVTSELIPTLDRVAERLIAARPRYENVSKATGVPWDVIAVIHEREASQSWTANLAQGDPWNAVSVHVPEGRGPFPSWEAAACDALTACAPHAASWHDWSDGGRLTLLEQYNGLGYANMGKPSPYIWAATNQYVKGKFISDHHFDPEAIDHQLGCAALLARIALLAGKQPAPAPVPQPTPAPLAPTWATLVIDILTALFKGK